VRRTELFTAALQGTDDERDDAMRELHRAGDRETFELAREWALDPDPARRRVGLNVLAQLGGLESSDRADWPFRPQTVDLLRPVLHNHDETPSVLAAAVAAAGHQHSGELLDEVLALRRHRDPEVRQAVASALTLLVHGLAELDAIPRLVQPLIELARDEDPDVREWALFELRTLHHGAPDESPGALRVFHEARRATHPGVRAEALLALAALSQL